MFSGKDGVINQNKGGFPEPLFRFVVVKSSNPGFDILACFLSNALSVESLDLTPSSFSSSSSSDSEDSDPDILSSSSTTN